MNRITLENFRCFREKQEARLAPLTLLVGENSTGKTSFLALIRVLWDVAFQGAIPNFKEAPYDLGSYDEIAHFRGGKGGRADRFEAGFDIGLGNGALRYEVAFEKSGTAPVPVKRKFSREDAWAKLQTEKGKNVLRVGDSKKEQKLPDFLNDIGEAAFFSAFVILGITDAKNLSEENLKRLKNLFDTLRTYRDKFQRPYASAPVRSKPRRTYDPARPAPDPEGESTPMYLAETHFHGGDEWNQLKQALEQFGKHSGLFDQFTIKRYGESISAPFQLQVKKSGDKLQGPWRNLVDVGYGVSQALPVITELLRPNAPNMSLMQQPEVHLHPSAQAALGGLFCELAEKSGRQLVVETHSDYLLDRVRMDVRDGESKLKPEDVSILYFEREDLDVKIHSLRLDKEGQIVDAPSSYRKFFMDEIHNRLKI